MTEEQWQYANILLEQMGFTKKEYREKYLYAFSNKHDREFISWTIDLLLKELDFKKNHIQVQQKEITNLPATAYSQYAFCPVSFSIHNSYYIEKDKSATIGLYLHGEQLLSKEITKDAIREASPEFKSIFENYPFDIIRESELIYSGHGENEHTYFHSHTGVRIGKPDYVFKDKKGKYFIVEEKTKHYSNAMYSDERKIHFRDHHKIQLLSYLRIKEYEISKGFLIYWLYKYKYQDDKPSIINAIYEELVLDDSSLKRLKSIWKELNILISIGKLKIDLESINEHKCIACKVSKYCFHKSKRYDEFTLPYDNLWV